MNTGLTKRIAGLVFAFAGTLFGAVSMEPVRAEQAGIESAQQALLARRFTMGVGRSIIVDLPRDATEIVVAIPRWPARWSVRRARSSFWRPAQVRRRSSRLISKDVRSRT